MPNIHGLFSNQGEDSGEDDSNNRFVGGISDRGGGRCVYWNEGVFSDLAVMSLVHFGRRKDDMLQIVFDSILLCTALDE